MLTGGHPWEGDNLFNIIFKQKNEDLPDLRKARPDLPTELVKILERALEKDRDRRWESAAAFLARLEELHLGEGSAVVPVPATATGAPAHGRPDRRTGVAKLTAAAASWPVRRWATAALSVIVLGGAMWGWTAWRARWNEGGVMLSGNDIPEGATLGAPSPGDSSAGPPTSAGGEVGPALEVVGDGSPSGPAGATIPLEFRVSGASGGAPARVGVQVVDGLGVLGRDTVVSDTAGVVRVALRLPDRPGTTTVEAGVVGWDHPGIRVEAVATAGQPQQVVALAGDGQSADVGAYLPRTLGVRVVDALGNPVPDTEVRFRVLVGEGTVAPPRSRTDSLGRASARWRLGAEAGEQRAAALVPSAEEGTVVFRATSRAQTPAEPPTEAGADTTRPAAERPSPPDTVEGNPSPSAPPRIHPNAFSVGGAHVCAIGARGFVDCRGSSDRGQTGEASDVRVRFVALAAGVSHACGLDATGTAYC
ncbi:MAG TPA: hypothetical protein VE173_07295, partial [Longimicrobiales bacterium]|nr:hypothetical protein [Longimicrobiales bacterium]